ncbi:MFS transporter [Actinoplanes aureus]|uniref:MFS transporter n=1 Tax=Actinoplanes aureus TaxID=2792083 RepID=A0A931CDN6_9ACTN|nr:MFS transporter [Actinoplanes aureus]MBG0565567.1 MFS transporter [Actinoplanes aureus]
MAGTGPDLGAVFVRWVWCRAVLHRGWWLVTSVYLVVDAHLRASQLVLIGVAQAFVGLVFEVPAGVVADTLSRKWSLVVSHLLMGAAMLATGLVSGFLPLLATQMLWGLAWTFASGADVAWISDELDDPEHVPTVLIRAEQAQLTGTVAGLAAIGGLAWFAGRDTAIVLAGAAMLGLGLYVAAGFPEQRFVPAPTQRWSAGWSILARGSRLVRHSPVLIALFAATLLVNGVTGAFGRLYPLRLVALAPGADPVLWLTGLSVLMCLAGAVALRVAQPRIGTAGTVRRGYLAACLVAAAGIAGVALAPDAGTASLGVLLAAGSLPLTRSLGTIWVDGQTVGAVRATVHSLLAQADYAGTIMCGLAVALIADVTGMPAALTVCATLLIIAVITVRKGSA